jgi:hypothetical protein
VFGNTSDGIKVCSVVVDGSWRNDLMVPKTWKQTNCEGWATKIGTGVHNLACLLKDRVQYDDVPGWNTCGW